MSAAGDWPVEVEKFDELAAEVDAEWQRILDNGGTAFLAAIDVAVRQTDYDDK